MVKRYFILIFFITNLINARPLRVLFVTGVFPYQPRQYIDNQIVGLIDAGVDVHVLASKKSLHENYALAIKYNFKNITFYSKLPVNQRSFDIIYCQFIHIGIQILEMRDKNLIQGKVVVCVRSGEEVSDIRKYVKKRKKLFKKADLILPVCKAFQDALIELGCLSEKVKVHHSAIDLYQFKYKKRTIKDVIKLVTVGRLIRRKGYKYTIDAIKILKKKYPNITYDIYGEGPLLQTLEKFIQKQNLSENVFLKGYCNHDILQAVLDQYNVFLLASCGTKAAEGIPNVLMEAMAMGFPIVATAHSGIPELVEDGISGLLVPEENVVALAQKIEYLIAHSELWESFGKAAREKVLQEHCKEKQNKKLLKLFRYLIDKGIE